MERCRISLTPANPVQGASVTVCYDFSGLTLDNTTMRVTFFPYGSAVDYEVGKTAPCFTISVPGTALAILVKDMDGPSPDKSAAVLPPI